MFRRTIDPDIDLALIQESFAPYYSQIVAEQRDYLAEWLAWPQHCQSDQDFRLFAQRMLHDYADGKSMTCAIFFRDELVGNCSFNKINYDTQCVEIGYWLSQHHRGKGIMPRAVHSLIQIVFEELNMEKVQLSAAVDNHASRRVAEKVGMVLEGILTNQEKVSGRILDHAVYGLKKSPLMSE
ncbi:GNAT family N-acetyltransferase [Vibrio pacinii]|uniref:GNAT family N-acetyltransferase n=1 Tax=Vibrio pacinii TaxID=170674 RepID=UPI00056DB231|nr:GNAT family protein [Vibrio pacinii]